MFLNQLTGSAPEQAMRRPAKSSFVLVLVLVLVSVFPAKSSLN